MDEDKPKDEEVIAEAEPSNEDSPEGSINQSYGFEADKTLSEDKTEADPVAGDEDKTEVPLENQAEASSPESPEVKPVEEPKLDEAPDSSEGEPKLLKHRRLSKKARLFIGAGVAVILAASVITGLWVHNRHKSQTTIESVNSFKAPVVKFKLISTYPLNNAKNVSTNAKISFNFSRPVNANKLINNVFITPTVQGQFKQGSSDSQVLSGYIGVVFGRL